MLRGIHMSEKDPDNRYPYWIRDGKPVIKK
jgi:hypothetical protein